MPLRDTSKMNILIAGEPAEVTAARCRIVDAFADLEFVDEGHHYYLHQPDGSTVELSPVSSFSHQFQEEFDSRQQAERYANRHGQTPQYWMDKWQFASEKASVAGTLVHAFAESLGWLRNGHPELITEECRCKYNAEKMWLVPTRHKEESVVKFFQDLSPDLHLVMNETKVYSSVCPEVETFPTNYAGTFDALYYYKDPVDDSRSGFVIYDWKTNADLYSDFARTRKKMCKAPFSDLYEEALSAYILQLSCYQIPLEDLGYKVIARRIVWLRDDGYNVLEVPDVTARIRAFLHGS